MYCYAPKICKVYWDSCSDFLVEKHCCVCYMSCVSITSDLAVRGVGYSHGISKAQQDGVKWDQQVSEVAWAAEKSGMSPCPFNSTTLGKVLSSPSHTCTTCCPLHIKPRDEKERGRLSGSAPAPWEEKANPLPI